MTDRFKMVQWPVVHINIMYVRYHHGAELIISNIRIARYTIWRYKTNLGRQPITQASIASKQQRASQMLLLATKKIRTLPQSTSLD
jgi:hypothetical protein